MEVTLTGMVGELDTEVVDALRAGIRGEVVVAEHPGYDAARAVWNGAIDRRPGAIARCRGPADVIHAVNVARSAGVTIAVRSGGHSFAGYSVCDGGLVIDLGTMNNVRVDPAGWRARCGAGALWGDLDHETQAFALATPGGVISHTGVAGLTLGGGMGWLNRRHGLSCDNLLSADVVTADGHFVRASEAENPELLWGLRGGGGNFGIVTSLEFSLHRVGPVVLAGLALFPVDRAREVATFVHEWAAEGPRDLSTVFGVVSAPPAEFVAPEAQGQPAVIVLFCWFGAMGEGERLVERLTALGPSCGQMVAPMPYATWQSALDADWAHGTRAYIKSGFVDTLTGDFAEAVVDQVLRRGSPISSVTMHQLGGAVRDVDAGAGSYPHREPDWNVNIVGVWDDAHGTEESETTWARTSWDALQPLMTGALYSNFIGEEADPERADLTARAYGDRKGRLAALKRRFDPTNLFRLNANVKPA